MWTPAVRMVLDSEKLELKVVAANCAFWDLDVATLHKVAQGLALKRHHAVHGPTRHSHSDGYAHS